MFTKKRALIIAYNDLNNSGVPNVIYHVVKSIYPTFDVDIVVFSDDNYYLNKLSNENININIIKIDTAMPKNKLGKIKYHLHDYPKSMFAEANKIMQQSKYDVIHSFKENFSWPFLKAAKHNGIEVRILHSNISGKRKKSLFFRLLNNRNKRKSIKYSTKLIGVTRDCCNSSFGKNLGIVIHNTYDEAIYNMQCKEVDDGKMVISQIATFNDNKNQLFSLKIANALKKSGVDFTLKLAGKETENGYLSKLENYIFENGLDDVVELIDGSSGVYEVYKASTFVLIPSKAEGASIVAVEAQACGIHVFSSSSVPHEMNVGGMSFIDLKDSPEKWTEEIISKYKEVGSKRFAFDMKPFSSESFKNNIVKIYNN